MPWATPVDLAQVNGGMLSATERTLTEDGLKTGSRVVPPGSLVLSTRAPIGYVAETSTRTAFNQGCRGLVPVAPVTLRYFRYQFSSLTERLSAWGQGSTFIELSGDSLAGFPLVVPPVSTQAAIAAYLDRQTTRIDALIAAKQRMVELLEERFAVLASTVTIGGIGQPEHRPSPSGLYGAIPTSWSETPLRHLGCEVQTGPFGSQLHAEEYIEGGWPVVNPMNIVDGRVIAAPSMTITTEKRVELSRHILKVGDIVFGRRGEMGRAGLIGPEQAGWLCGTGSLRVRLTGTTLLPEYLTLLFQTPPARGYFSLSSVGSTMENLNTEILLALPAVVPSLGQQAAIVAEVAHAAAERARLVDVLERQITLLQEHRQALIAAAVTGQLDIVEAA
jgi:type I restriction enzyme S subunit